MKNRVKIPLRTRTTRVRNKVFASCGHGAVGDWATPAALFFLVVGFRMGHVTSNRGRYLLSLAEELYVQSTRVRDLIGNAHWYSDGHHKEYLLVDLLRRHLPAGMLASRGFVISTTESERRSKEQDVLIVDVSQEAPIFSQSDMIIVFPRTVRAAISVKTKMEKRSIVDSVEGLNSVRDLATENMDPRLVWCGAYYFEVDTGIGKNPTSVYQIIIDAANGCSVRSPVPTPAHPCPQAPDLHCSARDFAFKLEHAYKADQDAVIPARLLGYQCQGLATAFFLGELLDHVATVRGASGSEFSFFSDAGQMTALDEPSRQFTLNH